MSAIDLSLCDPSLYLDFTWSVHTDLSGSDHYSLLIRSNQPPDRDALSSWKLDRAHWAAYTEACAKEQTIENIDTGDNSIQGFSETVNSITSRTIPKNKPGKRTVNPHQYTLRSLLIRTPGVHLDSSGISSFITQANDDVVSEMIF